MFKFCHAFDKKFALDKSQLHLLLLRETTHARIFSIQLLSNFLYTLLRYSASEVPPSECCVGWAGCSVCCSLGSETGTNTNRISVRYIVHYYQPTQHGRSGDVQGTTRVYTIPTNNQPSTDTPTINDIVVSLSSVVGKQSSSGWIGCTIVWCRHALYQSSCWLALYLCWMEISVKTFLLYGAHHQLYRVHFWAPERLVWRIFFQEANRRRKEHKLKFSAGFSNIQIRMYTFSQEEVSEECASIFYYIILATDTISKTIRGLLQIMPFVEHLTWRGYINQF